MTLSIRPPNEAIDICLFLLETNIISLLSQISYPLMYYQCKLTQNGH
jgi:hypothetical protein